MTTLRYKLLADVPSPEYKTAGASGIDLCLSEDARIWNGKTVIVGTGIAVEIPPGYEGHIRPRSSLSANGIVGHFGTIDSDYRGELRVVLTSVDQPGTNCYSSVTLRKGDRIAQLVIAPVERVELVRVEQLSETARGERGFGHTGKR